ncbi:MAG: UvrB/UvrC motif-containing protein, partial [Clostridiales bacterium]|nr:UvrB/UvrC motif-containing protein [Clostridiales bacterium]
VITNSMQRAIDETQNRRNVQMAYNEQNGIVPKTIIKPIKNTIEITAKESKVELKDINKEIDRLRSLMATASKELDFESAIQYRDKIAELRELQRDMAKAKALRNKK